MSQSPKRDSAGGSECCSLFPKQVAQSSTKGAPSATIYYHRTILESFKEDVIPSFGIMGDIYDSYAELKKLCMRNQEELVNYIDRAQTVYNQIIEAKKSSEGSPTDVEIIKLNKRFTHAFYCGLRGDIRSIIEKRNDLSPSEMYEMAETANQELKARREPQ